jgi:type II secretory pathway component PulM
VGPRVAARARRHRRSRRGRFRRAGWAFVWQPLTRDLEALRDTASMDRATLARARAMADEIAGMSRAAPPPRGDLRSSVERALGDRGLRAPAVTIEPQDDRLKIVVPAVPFSTLVAALDATRKDAAAFVVRRRDHAAVEPGSVRAEFVLAR